MSMKILPALCLALAPLPTAAKVLDSAENGFTVENAVTVPADAKAAWKALVKDVDRWWPKDHSWFGAEGKLSIEPRAGGCFCEIAGKRQVLHMTVGFADPGRLLRMLGGLGPLAGMGLTGTLDWTFAPAENGTRITLRYTAGGYTPNDLTEFAPVVDQVQGLQLGALAAFLSKAGASK